MWWRMVFVKFVVFCLDIVVMRFIDLFIVVCGVMCVVSS